MQNRPIVVVTFQGVIGDFFNDHGVSEKQNHIMSAHYN